MKHLSDKQIQLLIEDPGDHSLYLAHIQECGHCRKAYDSMQEVHNQLSSMEYEKPSMRFAKNIYELIIRKQALEQQEVKWIRTIHISLLSSVFLGFTLCFYYLFTRTWDLPLNNDSLSVYYKWSLTVLSSIIMLWIFYGIDSLLSNKKHN